MEKILKGIGIIIGVFIFLALLGATFELDGSAVSDISYLGHWKNIDPYTGGITTIDISKNGTGFAIHPWGKCRPDDCDLGEMSAHKYGSSVSSDTSNTTEALIAIFNPGFAEVMMNLRLDNINRLYVGTYTRSTDNRDQSDFMMGEIFERGFPDI